jgi:tRNA(adenine34) deaminase
MGEKKSLFTDEYYMKQALSEAHAAAREGEIPVGAIVVCNDRIIARAHNQTERLNDPTAHAEMLAITAATGVLGAKYLVDCTLYVTLEPCAMCAGAIGWSQISALVYGATDEKRGFRKYAPQALHPKTVVRPGVMEADCAAGIKDFFQNKR